MSEAWPLLIDATRIEFRAAVDRSNFLLTVHSEGHPPIDIRLPVAFGPELLNELQMLIQRGFQAPGRAPTH